jgi:hypothetical protein
MERVAREVGPSIYAHIACIICDYPVIIRRGRIIGLPPGSYRQVIDLVIRRQRTVQHRVHTTS